MTAAERDEKIQKIYDKLPRIKCRGKCVQCCGPIFMSAAEEERISEAGHTVTVKRHKTVGPITCSQLNEEKRCSIYEMRPLICRLFGIAEGMKCPYGCMPKGGHISDTLARQLLSEIEEIKCQSSLNDTSSDFCLAMIGDLLHSLESKKINPVKNGREES